MKSLPRRLFPFLALSASALAASDERKIRVLVLCTGNSARSQMAGGFLRTFDQRLEVITAGTQPAARVNPNAVRAMNEIGVDLSRERPKSVQEFLGQSFDFVITVCDEADESCPSFRGKVGKRTHIGFPDPAKASGSEESVMAVFRQVRDDIKTRFRRFYESDIKERFKQQ